MSNLKDIAAGGSFDTTDAIRTLAKTVHALAETYQTDVPAMTTDASTPTLVNLLNGKLAGALAKAGYATAESLRTASDEQLLAVDGVTEKALKLIREKTNEPNAGTAA